MSVKVGIDDFCSNCMEWQEYDEEGKCKVCGKIIKKKSKDISKDDYDEYTKESPQFELEEDSDSQY
ncbi:MAG: hypothetical protein R6V50_01860 [Thermoplasmatota archaeon]